MADLGPAALQTAADFGPAALQSVGAFGPAALQSVSAFGPAALQSVGAFGPAALQSVGAFGPAALQSVSALGPAAGLPPMDGFGPAAAPPPMAGFNPAAGLPPMGGFNPAAGLPPMGGFNPAAALPPMAGFNPAAALPPMGGFNPAAGLPPMDSFGPVSALPPMGGFGPMSPLQAGGVPMGHVNPMDGFETGAITQPQPFNAPMRPGAQAPVNEPATFAPRGLPKNLQNLKPAPESSGSGVPSAKDKRPAGDKRTAAQIVDDSPALKNLGRQKDIKFEQLCKQTGIDPKLDLKDAKQNPDAVYRLAKVLEFIDSAKTSTGEDRSNKVKNGKGDGNIEGITKDGDARHGTEAGMVKDFAEKGYSFLGEHQLPTTKDTHVKADGSNKDNFQWFAGEAGKHLWFLPGVSNVLTGIGDSEGGVKGAFEGAAKGYLNTVKGAAEGVLGAVTTGRINPASMIFGGAMGALANTEAAPQPVKDIASML
ncbi:hypothetical protein [Corallococcus macrosporus]|uniref:Uncharacterized protein n=1 Tax=Myxococcus fulvus (strain ATCC BAA-855 / HW-1) TaxID=483219 RepID=F8CGG6_MYXFH|nr:hypothetical protein [Corallococcus macrosporus]AEI68701.1 hypothetical protein LILAB_34100 [Corallococcus macrosporus]